MKTETMTRTCQSDMPVQTLLALPELAFFRGRVVPYESVRLGLLTHALNYGTGVFGGLRAFWNEEEQELFVFRPLDHFRRFLDSARLLRMDLPHSPSDLWTGLRELLRRQRTRTDCYVRALAFYGDETLGVRLHDLRPEVSIVALPFGLFVKNEENAHACISSWPPAGQCKLSRFHALGVTAQGDRLDRK